MITKELVEYIKNQVALGKDKTVIKQELISSGEWSSSDVQEAFDDKTSHTKRIFTIFFILFFLFVLAGIGFMYVYKDSLSTDYLEIIDQHTPVASVTSGNLLVLVEESLVDGLQKELDTYGKDVKRELNWDTEIKTVSKSDDIFSLKNIVKDNFKSKGLDGVLLVGNIPTGNMYHSDVDTNSIFNSQGYVLSDSIYQDINDDCIYSPQKQAFNYKKIECQTGITLQPYWVARLTPNSKTESSLSQLKSYFERNHRFRTGDISFNNKHLAYMPILNDLPSITEEVKSFKESFVSYKNYESSDLSFIDVSRSDSDKEYLSAISNPYEYESITFNGHGLPDFHQKDIKPNDLNKTSFVFLNLLSCSVGRFTSPDYLAGKYLFGGGLITLAASVPAFASSVFERDMYVMLSQGVPFYKAFQFGGIDSNILGDPTLKMRYNHTSSSEARLVVSVKEVTLSNTGEVQIITLKNTGSTPLLFNARLKFLKQEHSSGLVGSGYSMDANVISEDNQPNKLMPGKSTDLSFEPGYAIETKNLPTGNYEAMFLIISNDPNNPLVEIPVHFTM